MLFAKLLTMNIKIDDVRRAFPIGIVHLTTVHATLASQNISQRQYFTCLANQNLFISEPSDLNRICSTLHRTLHHYQRRFRYVWRWKWRKQHLPNGYNKHDNNYEIFKFEAKLKAILKDFVDFLIK